MGLVEQFANLGEEMLGSFDARVNFIGKNIVDVKNLKLDTHKILGGFHKAHKAMGNKLRTDLGAFVDDLSESVDGLRHKFQKEQKVVHQDCVGAHKAWEKVSKTMAGKKKNFKVGVTAAKQKASRAH